MGGLLCGNVFRVNTIRQVFTNFAGLVVAERDQRGCRR